MKVKCEVSSASIRLYKTFFNRDERSILFTKILNVGSPGTEVRRLDPERMLLVRSLRPTSLLKGGQ